MRSSSAPGKCVLSSIYIHVSALDQLTDDERAVVAQGQSLAGIVSGEDYNVAKIADDLTAVSFLSYPGFFAEGFPELAASWRVDLKQETWTYRTYAESLNPPILHRKELLLPNTHPERDCFAELTRTAEMLGLFDDPSRIGFRNHWLRLLAEQGYRLEGHRFIPLGNDEFPDEPMLAGAEGAGVQRHLTALVRYGFSAPIQSLMRFGLLDGRYTLFDYGCGR